MNKILVPTDFSENANYAIQFALNLAAQSESAVHLVHAVSASKKAGHFSSGVEELILEEKHAEMSKLLATLRVDFPAHLSLTGSIQQDYVIDAIITECDKIKADLVIMGTEGASGLKKWLVGSTTNALIKNTKLPVLAVPISSTKFTLAKICLALDLSKPVNTDALSPILSLCKKFNTQLDLLHVVSEKTTATTPIHQSLEVVLKNQKINYRAYQTIAKQSSEIDDAILLFAKDSKANLVCILNQSEQRGWWQNLFHSSVSEEIAYQTNIPLLVLHS
jgi:nucleotide-binding universal stress UspA family protein